MNFSDEEMLTIDYTNIFKYIEDPIEYIFVDSCRVIPGKYAEGTKLLSLQDWYFKVHFPGDPIMPGVFVMEAILQTAVFPIAVSEGRKMKLFFRECKGIKLLKDVRPGNILKTKVFIDSYKRGIVSFHGEAYVNSYDGEKVCDSDFIMVDESQLIRPKLI